MNASTNFTGCITDEKNLIEYLKKNNVERLPLEINNKQELRERLQTRPNLNDELIELIIRC